jgi:restriction endonuclease S subunit
MKQAITSVKHLSTIASLEQGHLFRKGISNLPMGYIHLIQPSNIDPVNGVIDEQLHMVRNIDVKESAILKKNDIIIKTKTNKPIAVMIYSSDNQFAVTNHFIIIRITDDSILPEYLTWFLNTRKTQEYFSRLIVGTNVPFLKKTALSDLEVPIPPKEKQERIAMLDRLRIKEEMLEKQILNLKKNLIEKIFINQLKRSD